MAEHYPSARILAVSNSATQRSFIQHRAAEAGRNNLEVRTADMREFETTETFDRVVSVEMFEHVKNYEKLMEKIAGMLEEEGRLFVHMFSHREIAFEYTTGGRRNWMARNFFAGGNMPSADLLLYFPRHLRVVSSWRVSGLHYARTLRAWLRNFDRNRAGVRPLFNEVYGEADARLWLARWRLFFIFCEVTFAYHGGNDYVVSHYLFEKNR
jgi:cyclopropane-fatty-acyl-phospholipid synthase